MLHFGECNELHLSQCADKTTTTRASWWYLSHFGILSTNSDSQEHHGECKSILKFTQWCYSRGTSWQGLHQRHWFANETPKRDDSTQLCHVTNAGWRSLIGNRAFQGNLGILPVEKLCTAQALGMCVLWRDKHHDLSGEKLGRSNGERLRLCL